MDTVTPFEFARSLVVSLLPIVIGSAAITYLLDAAGRWLR